jgi:hypothetical protein
VKRTFLASAFMWSITLIWAGIAIGSEGHKIIFLNLTLVDGVVRLDNVNVVPGKLKTPKKLTMIPGQILFTVTDHEELVLYEGVVRDPSNIRYEFVDHDGQLKSKWVVSDSVSFSVRMPYQENMARAKFAIIPDAPLDAGLEVQNAKVLGAVQIDLSEASGDE